MKFKINFSSSVYSFEHKGTKLKELIKRRDKVLLNYLISILLSCYVIGINKVYTFRRFF